MNELTDIDIPAKIIVVGKTGCGKTVLIERLIYDNKDKFKNIICFCPSTKYGTGDYSCLGDFVSSDATVDRSVGTGKNKEVQRGMISRVFEKQEKLAKLYKAGKLHEPPHCLIILDDILDSSLKLMGQDKGLFVGKLATCRHIYISLIIVVQTLHNTIPPGIREQTNSLYIFFTGIDGNLMRKMLPPVRNEDGKVMGAKALEDAVGELVDYPHTALLFNSVKRIYNQKVKVRRAPKFRIERYIDNESDSDSDD